MTIEQERILSVLREQNRVLVQRVADQDVELAMFRNAVRDLNRRLDRMREFLVPGEQIQVMRNVTSDSTECEWCDHPLPEHVVLTYGENSHSGVAMICAEDGCQCISTMSEGPPPEDVIADLRDRAQHPNVGADERSD